MPKPNYTELANIGTLGRENNQIIDDLLSTLKQIYVTDGLLQCDGKGTISGGSSSDILPDQTGNDGKYLKTDGQEASWENIPVSKMRDTTGIYAPYTITPNSIGNGSFLITEASGTALGSKSLSVSTGMNLTLKTSASAGATSYVISGSKENAIICAGLVGGVATLNENSSSTTSSITSITVRGSDLDLSTYSSGDITIKVSSSVNPDSSTNSIRVYSNQMGYSNLYVGQAVGGTSNPGGNIIAGQATHVNNKNYNILVGKAIYSAGNRSALFGEEHYNTKQGVLVAGKGHDTSTGQDMLTALGKYSNISSDTLFVIGNGSSNSNRSNAITVDSNGKLTLGANPTSNMDAATKEYVDSKAPSYYSITLSKSNWNNSTKEQTVSVVGVTSSNVVLISPHFSSAVSASDYAVRCIEQTSGTLKFKCDYIPQENLLFNIVIW